MLPCRKYTSHLAMFMVFLILAYSDIEKFNLIKLASFLRKQFVMVRNIIH